MADEPELPEEEEEEPEAETTELLPTEEPVYSFSANSGWALACDTNQSRMFSLSNLNPDERNTETINLPEIEEPDFKTAIILGDDTVVIASPNRFDFYSPASQTWTEIHLNFGTPVQLFRDTFALNRFLVLTVEKQVYVFAFSKGAIKQEVVAKDVDAFAISQKYRVVQKETTLLVYPRADKWAFPIRELSLEAGVGVYTAGTFIFTYEAEQGVVEVLPIEGGEDPIRVEGVKKVWAPGVLQTDERTLWVFGVEEEFDYDIFGVALDGVDLLVWSNFDDNKPEKRVIKPPEFLTPADITKQYLAQTPGEFSQCVDELNKVLKEFETAQESSISDLTHKLEELQKRSDGFEPWEF
jgi:hypothetical protein